MKLICQWGFCVKKIILLIPFLRSMTLSIVNMALMYLSFRGKYDCINWKEFSFGTLSFFCHRRWSRETNINFVSQIKSFRPPNLAPVVDIEEASFVYTPKPDKKEIQDALLTALKLVEEKTGWAPIVYTNMTFANNYLDNQLLSKYKLWLADYNKTSVTPNALMDRGYSIQQYKTFNDFPGIISDSGKLD